jgi:hypothetical protein
MVIVIIKLVVLSVVNTSDHDAHYDAVEDDSNLKRWDISIGAPSSLDHLLRG